MDTYGENLKGTPFSFPGIMYQILEDDVQHECLMNWTLNYEAKLQPCKKEPEEAVCRYFVLMRRSMPDRYE